MSSPREEGVRLTPEQWVEMFLAHDHAERINIAENVLRMADESLTCFIANHAANIRRLEAAFDELRETHAKAVEALVIDPNGVGDYTEAIRDAAFVIRNPGASARCQQRVGDVEERGLPPVCVLEAHHDGECRADDS